MGTDGQAKVSKSLNNVIYLADDAATVEQKVRGMYTDPPRFAPTSPARWKATRSSSIMTPSIRTRGEVEDLKERYRRGKVGDVEVKQKLARAINRFLDPIRERRAGYQARPELVEDILEHGIRRMRREAEETLQLVHAAMGMA